ncbi:metallophosphoesterase [Roseospirillum parvum]|uniref:Serine/threonine protein phosphatase 1 n=1 Tax=Roseospirillum parvum TaxID=83401 RepID=A0A1G7WM11_9PROT|nr:metallophosphoesterase [Roseospirillum parvum]SDG72909.1 serine/threonine protein phosphatase 1 [Roseospirillum parvum]
MTPHLESGPRQPAPGRLPPGREVIAIGDVHGQRALLDCLLDGLLQRLAGHAEGSVEVVFLGDLVDRGPDSAGVLDRVAAATRHGLGPARVHALMGNHEQMLRRALEHRPGAWEMFLGNGGLATARSLGADAATPQAALAAMARALHGPRRRLLEDTLKSHHRVGDYLCVHAGIDPARRLAAHLARPWDEVEPRHWAWIREPFLNRRAPFEGGVIAVHGHTPAQGPQLCANRLGIDTGAAYDGPLSALWLKDDGLSVIQAVP